MIGVILIWILVISLFLIGLVGIILPFMPGIPLIFIGALAYGIFSDFREITIGTVILLGGLTIFSWVIDYLSGILGARKFGASRYGIIGALLGMIVGLFSLGIVGIIIGPFIGAILFELAAGKGKKDAVKVGFGTFVGFLAGTLFKVVIGLTMIGLFLFRVIF